MPNKNLYNPFGLWGSYIGALINLLLFIYIYAGNFATVNPEFPILFQILFFYVVIAQIFSFDPFTFFLAVFIIVVFVGFFVGSAIHILFRNLFRKS